MFFATKQQKSRKKDIVVVVGVVAVAVVVVAVVADVVVGDVLRNQQLCLVNLSE